MPSSKGKPTDPQKREEAKKEVMNQEKGGGKGQWSAYKAAEMAKVYEAKGGGYVDTGDNPNKAAKGDPKPKDSAVKSGERKAPDAPVGAKKQAANSGKGGDGKDAKKTKSSAQQSSKPKAKEAKPAAKGTRSQPKRGVKASA